jgi:hypothetical protein
MSEKIYAILFRLFPTRFRTAWREEALDLLRDRLQNERGPRARLRLWLDLLADFAVSLPRAYLREEPSLLPAASANMDGGPVFHLIEERPIRSSAFFFASVLSILLIVGVAAMLKHGGHLLILHASPAAEAAGVTLDPWATGRGSGSGAGPELIGNGSGAAATSHAGPGSATVTSIHVRSHPMSLFDNAERQRVVDGVIDTLERHDPNAAAARRVALTLRANEALGRYRSIGDPGEFATVVTHQIRQAANDLHLELVYSEHVLPAGAQAVSPAEQAQYRAVLLAAHCGFSEVRILPHNIGYLKLDLFPPVDVCGDTAISAMKSLSRADALIIDLRDNPGGSPEMVLFLAGWLFDRPAFFWTPRYNSAAEMYTHSPMAGSGLANKPVWVLTSARTYSAAEHFSYDLKMLHRATLVGETTGGATDVGTFHRIDDHFGVGLLESKVPNPYPAPDWAVYGVQPDVPVPAADALATAENLAAR